MRSLWDHLRPQRRPDAGSLAELDTLRQGLDILRGQLAAA